MRTATDQPASPSDLASLSPALLLKLLEQKERQLAEREQAIADHKRVIAQKDQSLKAKDKLVKLLEEELRLARQRRFGSSSEKLSFQGDFFDEAELEQALGKLEYNRRVLQRQVSVSAAHEQVGELSGSASADEAASIVTPSLSKTWFW